MSQYASTPDLSGKVALITGAASGIGRATAHRMAEAGAAVVLADRDRDAGRAAAGELWARGARALFVPTEVTDSAQVRAAVEAGVEAFGGLHIAFNNAGVAGCSGVPAADLLEQEWARVIAVNLTAVWLCMKHELNHMIAHGGGAIVNTSSTAGLVAAVNSGVAYAASKHGVVGLTKTAAKEYVDQSIRINAVCPAGVDTPLLERTVGAARRNAAMAAGRVGTAEQVAEAVLWLVSPAASFVSGQALALDGARVT